MQCSRDITEKKPDAIRSMFSAIPVRYDFLNTVLSLDLDRRWRESAVKLSGAGPGTRVLDVCTGTGVLALAFARAGCRVAGIDFSMEMLMRFRKKLRFSGRRSAGILRADALALPFADESFDVVSVAFGIRNMVDAGRGLAEMARVARPGGRVVVLEFSRPEGRLFGRVYGFYLSRILPAVGGAVSGSPFAYSYLAESIRTFPDGEAVAGMMREAGCPEVETRRFLFGAVTLYIGEKGV